MAERPNVDKATLEEVERLLKSTDFGIEDPGERLAAQDDPGTTGAPDGADPLPRRRSR